jgi:hypothetical protein
MERSGPDKPRFSLRQAAVLTGTEITWIHELIRKGYFEPAMPTAGRGKPNMLCFNDLVKLDMLKALGKMNLLKTAAATVVKKADINKCGRYFSMGPATGGESRWEKKFDTKPTNDDFTLSFNLDRTRKSLSRKMKTPAPTFG